MSEVPNPETYLESLKKKADLMGIKYHHKVGEKRLESLIEAHTGESLQPEKTPITPIAISSTVLVNGKETKAQKKARLMKEANTLIRARITCMNPNKKEWEGETMEVGNRAIGAIKKYILFDQEYHIPKALLDMIQRRKCQIARKDRRNGKTTARAVMIKEFGVEILPPLTQTEMADIAKAQAAIGAVG